MNTYYINEIFYSLQGEGYHTGTAATFIRFSGCNLKCPFCDTSHENGRKMTLGQIVNTVSANPSRLVVLTGGEPSLQADGELIAALHEAGKFIAIETNGTRALPEGIDWITCSPKPEQGLPTAIKHCDELKVVYTGQDMSAYDSIDTSRHFIQPCYTQDAETNRRLTDECIEICKTDPRWRLSLQTHKLIGFR